MNDKEKNASAIGGLVGKVEGGKVKIVDSYAEGTIMISGTNGTSVNAGVIIGTVEDGEVEIENMTSKVNIVTTQDVFNDIRKQLERIDNIDVKKELIVLVDDMEKSIGKTTFKEKYNAFMATAAEHLTLATPLFAKLTEFL